MQQLTKVKDKSGVKRLMTKQEIQALAHGEFLGRPIFELTDEEVSYRMVKELYHAQLEFAEDRARWLTKTIEFNLREGNPNVKKDQRELWHDESRLWELFAISGVALVHIPYAIKLTQGYFLGQIEQARQVIRAVKEMRKTEGNEA